MASKQERLGGTVQYTWHPGHLSIRMASSRFGFKMPHDIVLAANFEKVLAQVRAAPTIAIDTETTSLNPFKAKLCCVSFCFGGPAYVVYAHHSESGAILPRDYLGTPGEAAPTATREDGTPLAFTQKIEVAPRDLFLELMQAIHDVPGIFFFNANYDFRILRNTILEINWRDLDNRMVDVQGLIFISDTNNSRWSLKSAAKYFLGVDPPEFDQEATGENIFIQDIRELTFYAGYDAWDTYSLAKLFYPEMKKLYPFIISLDNKLHLPMIDFEENILPVNWDIMQAYAEQTEKKIELTKEEFFSKYGIMNMGSNKQKGDLLQRLGFDTGEKTPGGDMAVGIKLLEKIKDRCEAASLLINYSKLIKSQSTYISPMLERRANELPIRFKYRQYIVPTYRLAAGSPDGKKVKKKLKNMGFWVGMNVQSAPKPKQAERYADFDPVDFTWNFHPKGRYKIETGAEGLSWRKAFEVDEDEVWLSTDFSGQEIVIVANASGDETMIAALLSGEDFHKEMAIQVWGKENYDKNKRKTAKTVIFACPTKDVRLNTSRGLICPQELTDGDLIFDKHGNLQDWKIDEVDDQDVFELQFSTGIIESYHVDHKFQCFTPDRSMGWVAAKDLTPQHEIITSTAGPEFYRPESAKFLFNPHGQRRNSHQYIWDTSDEFLAYFIGLFLGNGNLSPTDSTVRLVVKSEIFSGVAQGLRSRGFSVVVLTNIGDCVEFRTYSAALAQLLRDHFPGKTMPRILEYMTTPVLKAILSGLLDSDGGQSQGRNVFYNSNPVLISDTARLVAVLGGTTRLQKTYAGITLSSGERRYHGVTGAPYKEALKIVIYLNDELPVMVKHKKISTTRLRHPKLGFNNIPMGFYEQTYRSRLAKKGYHGKDVFLLDNLRTGRQQKLTPYAMSFMADEFTAAFELPSKIVPVTVVKSTPKKDNIYVLETANHEYLSSYMVSHNCIYGGDEHTVAKNAGITLEEAKKIVEAMKKRLPTLFKWIEMIKLKARQEGTLVNMYGLPRQLAPYYRMGKAFSAFADRSSVNTLIQSCGGVIIRMVLRKLWELLAIRYGGVVNVTNMNGDHVDMTSEASFLATIHDEVNVRVKKRVLLEFLTDFDKLMLSANIPTWKVKAGVEHSIGRNWAEVAAVTLLRDDAGNVVGLEPKGELADHSREEVLEKPAADDLEEVTFHWSEEEGEDQE